MQKNKLISIAVGAVLAIMIGAAVYQNVASDDSDRQVAEVAAKPGFQAPSFELTGFDGNSYAVGGKRDKPLLINFWASWCGPCHIEAPDLQELYEHYNGKLDLYAVNVTSLDTRLGVEDFIEEYGLTFPIPMDETGEVTSKKYGINGYPASFLIDQNGTVVDVIFSVINREDLERKIDKLLK